MDPDRSLENVNKNSFTSNIWYARNPSDFKLLTLDVYNGRTVPTIHLMRYIQHMEVLGASKEVMGRVFLLYLTDLATMRFRQLENGSISTWTELVKKFIKRFRVHITRSKNVMMLSSVRQRADETLRSYLIDATQHPLQCKSWTHR